MSIKDSATKLSQGLIDLKVRAASLAVAAERERKIAALRANASSELKALQSLKSAFEPQILQLAGLDLSPLKDAGANLDALDDAQGILASLDKAIEANQSIVTGAVDPASLLDTQRPFDTAAIIQERVEILIEAVAQLC